MNRQGTGTRGRAARQVPKPGWRCICHSAWPAHLLQSALTAPFKYQGGSRACCRCGTLVPSQKRSGERHRSIFQPGTHSCRLEWPGACETAAMLPPCSSPSSQRTVEAKHTKHGGHAHGQERVSCGLRSWRGFSFIFSALLCFTTNFQYLASFYGPRTCKPCATVFLPTPGSPQSACKG